MPTVKQVELQRFADRAAARSNDATRHKCFVSYHQDDEAEVRAFIDSYSSVFIARVLGATDEDDFIQSDDPAYVMRQIRERYLKDSTVTIVMVGKCTWARKFVDWEIASTLRNDSSNKRSGLIGVTLKSNATSSSKRCPDRLDVNLPHGQVDGYARWKKYPSSSQVLRESIQDAFDARNARSGLVKNSAALFEKNRTC